MKTSSRCSFPRTARRLLSVAAALSVTASLLSIQAVANDQPVTWTTADTDLVWGPCPDFFPDGCELAVLQGDPAEPNTDVFFKLPGGSTAPNHWHTSAERMVLISGRMHVDYEGHEPVVLTPGTYAYGPPELPHTATCEWQEPCVLFIAFEEPVDAIPVTR